jgi:hypothetical protein
MGRGTFGDCLLRGLVVERALEQQNVRLRLVNLVVLPAQALRDAQAAPLVLPQQLERALGFVVVVGRDELEHGLGEADVTVLVLEVLVPGRVVDRVDKLLEAVALRRRQRPRLLVAPRHVNVHVFGHGVEAAWRQVSSRRVDCDRGRVNVCDVVRGRLWGWSLRTASC